MMDVVLDSVHKLTRKFGGMVGYLLKSYARVGRVSTEVKTGAALRLVAIWLLILALTGCAMSPGPGGMGLTDFFTDPSTVELVRAAERGDLARVDKLVAAGANVNDIGYQGMTPLLWVFYRQNRAGFEKLLQLGADPAVTIKNGSSVMSLAAEMGDSFYLKKALQYGGNPDPVDIVQKVLPTPLYSAMASMRFDNLQLLIEGGADLDYQNVVDDTPLIFAASINQWRMVYMLLEAGADFRLPDNLGYTLAYNLENNFIVEGTELYEWRQKVVRFVQDRGFEVHPISPAPR